MKKCLCLFLCFVVLFTLVGCGNNASSSKTKKQQSAVNDVFEESVTDKDSKSENKGGTEGIDVDLTKLSSTMVYSEVYNMMVSPKNYIGKTVKMKGLYSSYHDETSSNNYYFCIIADATACCSQGIEFVLKDEYTYPDDYPKEGENICVVGVFDTYQEGNYTYCTLKNARIVKEI